MYFTVTIRVNWDEETRQYVARGEELGVSTAADTIDDAIKGVQVAIDLYLNTLEEVGERERVFQERGITVYQGEPDREQRLVCTVPDSEVVKLHTQRLHAFA